VSLALHGVVARWELLAAGFSAGVIDSLVRDGSLYVLHRGVYAVGRPEVTQLGKWRAAVIACGPDAALSHRSAAALQRLRAARGSRVDVTVRHRGTHRARGIAIHVTRTLRPEDVVLVDGIPCTAPERTLLDLADVLTLAELERVAEAAYRERVLRVVPLHRQLNAPGRRCRKLARALRVTVRNTRSKLERRFLSLVAETDLPEPLENVWFPELGVEVDALWPNARLVVEIDSRYHDTPHARERDERKDGLLRAAGYTVVRVRGAQFARFIATELPRLVAGDANARRVGDTC